MKLHNFVLLAACCAGCGLHDSAQSQARTLHEEPVHFASGALILAGTLILPRGAPPYPAVFLFHGSGRQARDLTTARWFAEQGFAALAYDKRGVGESTGAISGFGD